MAADTAATATTGTPLPVSLAVITLDEEANLDRCLGSLADLVSEIVVVDSGSTDRTEAIARQYGARFEFNAWPGHVAQKNHALGLCTQPWVLSLDADEAASDELRQGLVALFAGGDPSHDGYSINRRTFYLGAWIWHAWYPEWRLRLVRRELAGWQGHDPHDWLGVEGSTERISGDLLHYSYRDLADHLRQTVNYARIGAESYWERRGRFPAHRLLLSPWGRLLKVLIIRQAWRDGWRGLIIAFSAMFVAFAKYAFLYERHLDDRRRRSGDQ